jgi:hypothetical protein
VQGPPNEGSRPAQQRTQRERRDDDATACIVLVLVMTLAAAAGAILGVRSLVMTGRRSPRARARWMTGRAGVCGYRLGRRDGLCGRGRRGLRRCRGRGLRRGHGRWLRGRRRDGRGLGNRGRNRRRLRTRCRRCGWRRDRGGGLRRAHRSRSGCRYGGGRRLARGRLGWFDDWRRRRGGRRPDGDDRVRRSGCRVGCGGRRWRRCRGRAGCGSGPCRGGHRCRLRCCAGQRNVRHRGRRTSRCEDRLTDGPHADRDPREDQVGDPQGDDEAGALGGRHNDGGSPPTRGLSLPNRPQW